MGLLTLTWGALAIVGGLPAIFGLACRARGKWHGWAAAIVIVPYWAFVFMQMAWPIGGLSNVVFRLWALIAAVFVAEAVLLMPRIRSGPVWSRIAIFVVAVISTVPIHFAFPPLSD
jgi:hypothetical protein